MTDDQRATQLQLLANIVIDAYLNRDKQFVPDFGPGVKAILYGSRPEGDKGHPGLRTDIWYERDDYDPKVTPGEQKT